MSIIRIILLAWAAMFFLVPAAHASDADAAVAVLCPKHAELAPDIESAASAHGVSPMLLTALVFRESTCDKNAVSKTGRMGLGQLTPWGPSANGLTREEMKDPKKNLEATARWLALCMVQCAGNLRRALGAYHTGHCEDGDYTDRVLRSVKHVWKRIAKMAKKEA